MAGRPGSGIGNAVTALVLGLALLYGPDELDLKLIGLDSSPELARFAEHALPHASLVATDADPALAVAVLADLMVELDRRYALLRETVGERAGLTALRDATGEVLPAIVCVIDHYGALADRRAGVDDPAPLLERLERMGGAVGIHLVLTTPSTDARALQQRITRQMRPRLLLRMDGPTAAQLAGEELVDELAALTLPGDACLLAAPGDTEGARSLRTVLVEPAELELCLRDARRLADGAGWRRRPRVVVGDRPAQLEHVGPDRLIGPGAPERRATRLLLGEPLELGDPVEVHLRRAEGANLLAVTPDAETGQGLMLAATTTAAFVHGAELATMALDFMPMEAGFGESMQLLGSGPWTVQSARRRSLQQVLDVIVRIVEDRREKGDDRGKAVLFVINGLGRSQDLRLDGPEARRHLESLTTILRDGPRVGVHTLAWCDSTAALAERLPPELVAQFALRVAGPMAAAEGLAFAETEITAGLAPNQTALADLEAGRLEAFVPFAGPARQWLLQAVEAAAGRPG